MLYMYLMTNQKALTDQLVRDHVEHLKALEADNKLVLCGPFSDYPGGMVVFMADSHDQAVALAESNPFIASGHKTYELRTLEVANKDNNYLV